MHMTLLTVLLLQADTALGAVAAAPAPVEKISMLNLLMEGGALMIPLLLCWTPSPITSSIS